ncbi:hypothetical protein OEA41_007225 [Lepraria neglecta]|uniref:Uncharacterized protein n=1 Tax=Lepraria neglecta TaxID=209136 RepID=A0AAE0DMS5_9LECA|nr:hypothetical protein OEA41_007225 [Lepraria neglecta]
MSRKDKETSMPALPGMSTFALSSSSSPSPEVEIPDPLGSLSTKYTPRMLSLDNNTVAVDCAPEGSMSDFWQHNTRMLDSFSLDAFLQQPSNLLFGANELALMDDISACGQGDGIAASMKTSYSVDSSAHAEFQDLSLSPSNTPRAESGADMDTLTEERPGPLVDLTALLAEMSPYENRLSKLSSGELHNYPIGDALFFSHRFYAILSDYSHLPSTDSTSQLSTPTMLLALSCFMTLTRIYSPIFGHLHEQLSRMLEAHSAHESRSCAYPSMGADIHSYRGLRLSQLQPICLCAGWDPTKKAVSMLLSSLGGAEGWLGLPPDVRIMAIPGAEAQGEQTPRLKGIGGEKTVLFEEGSMATLTNGHLYKTVGKQAKELRRKIEEVEELLKGVTDIAYVLRTPPELGKE